MWPQAGPWPSLGLGVHCCHTGRVTVLEKMTKDLSALTCCERGRAASGRSGLQEMRGGGRCGSQELARRPAPRNSRWEAAQNFRGAIASRTLEEGEKQLPQPAKGAVWGGGTSAPLWGIEGL